MRGAMLYGPRDVRFEEREAPTIIKPTDAIINDANSSPAGEQMPRGCHGTSPDGREVNGNKSSRGLTYFQ